MKSETNNLFESYNINLDESNKLDNQLKSLGILEIGASSEHKRADEDELDKLQGQEFVKRLNDNPNKAQWYGYIYIKHKDLGDIFVSYNTNTNEIDTTGFPWKFIEEDTTPEQQEFVENNKEFLNNYIKSGEISKYKNLEESTKELNEDVDLESISIEDVNKMSKEDLITLYANICEDSQITYFDLLQQLETGGCLNTGSFRDIVSETIEYLKGNY